MDLFENYFVNTYYALCKVLDIDVKLLAHLMMMVIDMQNRNLNRNLHYAKIILDGIHRELMAIKSDDIIFNLK